MTERQAVNWVIDSELVEWLQGHPGSPSEAAERLLRRQMDKERALLAREGVDELVALLDGAPA